jgi:single-stranded-DNA-specific exonuclease
VQVKSSQKKAILIRTLAKNPAVVISHRKDADGIACAALGRYMSGGEIFLTDYEDMVETLSRIEPTNDVYISDLALNPSTFPGFYEQVKRLLSGGRVHYTDHHPLSKEFSEKLTSAGVDLYNSQEESAAVLVYMRFQDRLNTPRMKIAACCGAITDYLDSQPFAKKLIASFDRQFLLYEATVLSFVIASYNRGTSQADESLTKIAVDLASGKLPHELDNASELSQAHAARSAAMMERLATSGKKMKNFAYLVTNESATGNVANFLIGAFDVPVGVALREEKEGYYEISLRSRQESAFDLGKIVGRIAVKMGTSGGGHPHASGARIKRTYLDEFLALLDGELSRPQEP